MDIRRTSAIVTGGASGLGAATARRLAQAGARVLVLDIQDEAGIALADDIGAEYAHADVTSEDQVIAAVEKATRLAPLRSLVNCAGVARPARTIGRDGRYASAYSLETFTRLVSINLVGTFNCIRLAATAMSRMEPDSYGQRGAIVNTSSIAAYDGPVGQTGYAASKAAIAGMTLPIARDLAPVGIRVNTIAPGLFDTPLYEVSPNADQIKEGLQRHVLFPFRFGDSDEFASLALELLTNDYMNAEVVRLDGGARLPPK